MARDAEHGVLGRFGAALERALKRVEERRGRLLAALLVASLLMLLAALYVRPSLATTSHGIYYAELSHAPLSPSHNPNAYRVLTPLLAHILGLSGDGILIVEAFMAWGLLAAIYLEIRRRQLGPLLALEGAALMAFSMPTLCTLYYGGYPDSTSYLIAFLMLTAAGRPWLFWSLFLLGPFNRESIVFLYPFLMLWRARDAAALLRMLPLALLALLPYLAFRAWVDSRSPVAHSFDFYTSFLLSDPFFKMRVHGRVFHESLFSAFKLLWLLPLLAAFTLGRRPWRRILLILSPIALAFAQLFLSLDSSRMLALAFPAILLAFLELAESWQRQGRDLATPILGLILLNLLVPQRYVTMDQVMPMKNTLNACLNEAYLGRLSQVLRREYSRALLDEQALASLAALAALPWQAETPRASFQLGPEGLALTSDASATNLQLSAALPGAGSRLLLLRYRVLISEGALSLGLTDARGWWHARKTLLGPGRYQGTLFALADTPSPLRFSITNHRRRPGVSKLLIEELEVLGERLTAGPTMILPDDIPWRAVSAATRLQESPQGLVLVTSESPYAYQLQASIPCAEARALQCNFELIVERGGVTLGWLSEDGQWARQRSFTRPGRYQGRCEVRTQGDALTLTLANHNPDGVSRIELRRLTITPLHAAP